VNSTRWKDPIRRAKLRERVREVCLELLRCGVIPSESRLSQSLPYVGSTTARILRDELREDGELPDWTHLVERMRRSSFAVQARECPGQGPVGLTGESERERRLIEAAIAEERARKEAAGPPLAVVHRSDEDWERMKRVYANPFPDE